MALAAALGAAALGAQDTGTNVTSAVRAGEGNGAAQTTRLRG